VNAVEAFAGCQTTAKVRRTMILAENRLTPEEVIALRARRDDLPSEAREWIERFGAQVEAAGPVTRFARRTLSANVTLLEAEPPSRALLVVFCGQVPRPMLPLCLFLQHVPPGCDVAMLWDPERLMYLRGIRGFADGPAALAARLRAVFEVDRYATVRALGSSSGGAAALAVGALMGVEQAVALGGLHPSQDGVCPLAEEMPDLFGFEAALRDAPPSATRLICGYGEDYAIDRDRAEALLQGFRNAIGLPIAGVDDHNILLLLMRRGDLARFLDQAAFGRFEAGRWE